MAGLHAAGRGGDGQALAPQLLDGRADPLGGQPHQLVLGEAGAVDEPARLYMMDDVHDFENQAGNLAQPRLAHPGGEQEQLLHVLGVRHRVGHVVAEGGAQVVHRLVEDALQARAVDGIVGLEEAEAQVAVHFLAGVEMAHR